MKRKFVSKLLWGCFAMATLIPGKVLAEPIVTKAENLQEVKQDEAEGNWIKSGNRWWYCHKDNSYTTSGWELIDNEWYYFDAAGWMTTGWQLVNGSWYYMADSGKMLTGWQWVNGKCYYMYESGAMASSTWIGDYYVDSSGAWIQGKTKPQPKWIKSGNRWWYRHWDGSYTASGWELINNEWYYFDAAGWMTTGWQLVNGTWYYMDNSGKMLTGWQWVNGKCYYLNDSGAMAADTWVGEYYVDASGAWIEGKLPAGWVFVENRRWYRHEDGSYTTSNWELIDNEWYYFDSEGWMTTGWLLLNEKWYYLNENGQRVTGWIHLENSSYFLKEDGTRATDEWIGVVGMGGSYVGQDGVMLVQTICTMNGYNYSFNENGICYEVSLAQNDTTNENYLKEVDPLNGITYNLEKTYRTDPQVGVNVTEDELLAATVYAEAGNQKMPGMTGVALVILNRMNDKMYHYPDSAAFVIYQSGQFQVARDGSLTKWLKNKDNAILNDAKEAVKRAKEIMNAYVTDGVPRKVDGLTMPEGKTDFNYLGFMTPSAFNSLNLDWEKTEAFTYLNTTFYTRWIEKN